MSKIIIFANGISHSPQENLQYIAKDDIIICADGGARYALELDITPQHLVGDFDSLDNDSIDMLRAQGAVIEKHPANKEKTDLELAIETASQYPSRELLVLTAFGGRIDQMLGNILLLAGKKWPFTRTSIADGPQHGWFLNGPDELAIPGNPGDVLSVVPLAGPLHGLDILGVKWPLDKKNVEWGSTLTLSNEISENTATVSLKEGRALVVRIKHGPAA